MELTMNAFVGLQLDLFAIPDPPDTVRAVCGKEEGCGVGEGVTEEWSRRCGHTRRGFCSSCLERREGEGKGRERGREG
jgi:hypothetical protein